MYRRPYCKPRREIHCLIGSPRWRRWKTTWWRSLNSLWVNWWRENRSKAYLAGKTGSFFSVIHRARDPYQRWLLNRTLEHPGVHRLWRYSHLKPSGNGHGFYRCIITGPLSGWQVHISVGHYGHYWLNCWKKFSSNYLGLFATGWRLITTGDFINSLSSSAILLCQMSSRVCPFKSEIWWNIILLNFKHHFLPLSYCLLFPTSGACQSRQPLVNHAPKLKFLPRVREADTDSDKIHE